MRLRVNRLLNMSGTRGRTAGNALGVLGLFYAALESGLGHYADGSVPEAATSVGAGRCCQSQLCLVDSDKVLSEPYLPCDQAACQQSAHGLHSELNWEGRCLDLLNCRLCHWRTL